MLDIGEIEYWISRHENEPINLREDCVNLAALYIIRDKISGSSYAEHPPTAYSLDAPAPAGETLDQYGDSEFLQAVAGKTPETAWAIMDELMDTLRVVNSKTYESVMRKLSML